MRFVFFTKSILQLFSEEFTLTLLQKKNLGFNGILTRSVYAPSGGYLRTQQVPVAFSFGEMPPVRALIAATESTTVAPDSALSRPVTPNGYHDASSDRTEEDMADIHYMDEDYGTGEDDDELVGG
jgi:hypothetical protein